jgi:hypothetical protein
MGKVNSPIDPSTLQIAAPATRSSQATYAIRKPCADPCEDCVSIVAVAKCSAGFTTQPVHESTRYIQWIPFPISYIDLHHISRVARSSWSSICLTERSGIIFRPPMVLRDNRKGWLELHAAIERWTPLAQRTEQYQSYLLARNLRHATCVGMPNRNNGNRSNDDSGVPPTWRLPRCGLVCVRTLVRPADFESRPSFTVWPASIFERSPHDINRKETQNCHALTSLHEIGGTCQSEMNLIISEDARTNSSSCETSSIVAPSRGARMAGPLPAE